MMTVVNMTALKALGRATSICFVTAALAFGYTDVRSDTNASAQVEPQAATTGAPAPAKPLPPVWEGKISGGVQFESGRTEQRAVSISGDVAKVFTPESTVSFEGSVMRATLLVAPRTPRYTGADNMSFAGQYLRKLKTKRFFLVDRAFYTRDTVTGVGNRFINATGVGINLILSPKGQFYIVPAFAMGTQDTDVKSINGFTTGFASFQKFDYKLSDMWSISQNTSVRINGKNIHDTTITGYAGLMAPAIYKRLFLSIGVDYNYEGMLFPNTLSVVSKNDAVFIVKFNYKIGR